MPVNGPSVPLTAGKTVQIPTSIGPGTRKLAAILIQNLSPFAIELNYGSGGQWVSPFVGWPIPQSQLGQITVVPAAIAGASTPGVVLPTYYFQGEQFPTQPITLPTSAALYGLTTPTAEGEGQSPTYSSAIYNIGLSVGANTDVFTIQGTVQNKVIRINRIEINGVATAATSTVVILAKRTSGDTASGTPGIAVPHDSSDAAATAIVYGYSTAPASVGNLVGRLRNTMLLLEPPATPPVQPIVWDWLFVPTAKRPTLREFEAFCINLPLAATPGGALAIAIEWTEDAT